MDERPEQIEDHIRSTQRELGSHLQELEDKVKDATNWRVQFERHPMALLGIAFAGALLLSAGLGGGRRRSHHNYYGQWVPASHASASGLGSPATDLGYGRKQQPSNVWHGIKGALLAAAGTQVSNVLGELLPGFKDYATEGSEAAARSAAPPASANGVHEEIQPMDRQRSDSP